MCGNPMRKMQKDLLISILWWCFNRRLVSGGLEGAESRIQSQLKLHLFPGRFLAEAIYIKHSGILYRLDISKFYFYKPLLFQIFVLPKFIKT